MKKYILIIAAFFTAGISGCKKDYLSLEVNPNEPSVTTPQLTLSAALNNSAAIIVADYVQDGVWAGYLVPSGNFVPSTTISEYQFTNANFTGSWTNWYSNLTNYNNLINLGLKDPSLANFQAIAMIMKAYGFQHLVDDYNDVPYTQAFQPSTILLPAYDKGPDIYHDLGKQLDNAIALINKSGAAPLPGPSDIVYGKTSTTEMANWKKFANTLKLRLAIRVSTKTPGDPLVSDLAATASEGYLTQATEARANPGYSDVAGKQNPFYGGFGLDPTGNEATGSVTLRANAFAVTTLTDFNDPRLTTEYNLTVPAGSPAGTPPSIVHGNVFGDTKATNLTNSNTSGVGPGLDLSPSQDAILFSGSESLFLQSEAALNGFIPGGAAAAQIDYQAGITASFEAQGLTDAKAATYYGQSIVNVGWAASTNKQEAIIYQKWIALNGYFNFEGWNEYRRTGFPVHPSSIDPAVASPTFPTRIFYPLSELSTNDANLNKEGTINPFTSKIFWAK